MIKMYNFNSQYKMIKDEIDSSIQSVLNDSAFSSGKYVQNFENKFSNYIGSKYCVAVNNGTSVLHAALLALGVKPGITGLAAMAGYRGGTEDLNEMQKRINIDIKYIESWTFWSDIKICWSTFTEMIGGKSKGH